jgi:phosphatidylserine/phosphatidylglycerophosphate/cardiolipin synthase-like enzyme/uncharacterized membrane protein YdjX (TVP38/TMEM64 family)
VDGEDYFATLREGLISAQRCIAIAAWDIHSRVELVRPTPNDGWPTALGELLMQLLEARPALEVFILLWDYAPIYLLEREPLFFGDAPWGESPWGQETGKQHPRLHFIKDNHHPLLASQHQKLVLIDGTLAFCGGIDPSKWRWDSHRHLADEPRRRDPEGAPYPPFHDLQMLVDGDAAIALGELFIERWQHAGGAASAVLRRLAGPHADDPPARRPQQRTPAAAQQTRTGTAPWPKRLEPLLHNQPVGIARTLPDFEGQQAARESEQLYLDMIAASERLLYIENQYLTARSVAAALRASLSQPQGPEIIILMPRETGHWLEQHTMDLIRARLLAELRAADGHGRLRLFYPEVDGLTDGCMMVHAKLMIADDRILRIGSSNLSNRSMGLDSECDLCVVAETEADQAAIRALRHRLLAMFLAIEPADWAEAEAANSSIAEAIAQLQQPATMAPSAKPGPAAILEPAAETEAEAEAEAQAMVKTEAQVKAEAQAKAEASSRPAAKPSHRLLPLEDNRDPEWYRQMPDERLIDPDRPLSSELLSEVMVGEEHKPHARWRLALGLSTLLLFAVLAALWRWTPLGDWLQPQLLAEIARSLSQSLWGVPVIIAAFVLASLAAVPVTLLILVTTLVFEPLTGALIALSSSTLAAIAGYRIGRYTGAQAVEARLGGRLADLHRRLTQRGILAIVTLRIVPVAPFAVLNLIAGAMQVRFRDYVLGTLFGMAPAVIAMALFAEGLLSVLGRADLQSLALLIAAVLALVGLAWLGRWLLHRHG